MRTKSYKIKIKQETFFKTGRPYERHGVWNTWTID